MSPRARSRPLLAASLLAVVAVLGACVGRGEPVPPVIDRYLKAVEAGDLATAYDLTFLDEIASQPGAALSKAHFEAFYRATPLERYSVKQVIRQEIRSIDRAGEPGAPYFTVDVQLVYADGPSDESFAVEGEVLPRVQVEPDPLFFRAAEGSGPVTDALVDGVPTTVRQQDGTFALIVLQGRHTIEVAGSELVVRSGPVTVVEGPASVGDDDVIQLRV